MHHQEPGAARLNGRLACASCGGAESTAARMVLAETTWRPYKAPSLQQWEHCARWCTVSDHEVSWEQRCSTQRPCFPQSRDQQALRVHRGAWDLCQSMP